MPDTRHSWASFSDPYSDGEERVERPLSWQECANRKCRLPCKFWVGVADMIDVLVEDESIMLHGDDYVWTGNGDLVFVAP
jgi:hypothetical protein